MQNTLSLFVWLYSFLHDVRTIYCWWRCLSLLKERHRQPFFCSSRFCYRITHLLSLLINTYSNQTANYSLCLPFRKSYLNNSTLNIVTWCNVLLFWLVLSGKTIWYLLLRVTELFRLWKWVYNVLYQVLVSVPMLSRMVFFFFVIWSTKKEFWQTRFSFKKKKRRKTKTKILRAHTYIWILLV